jgi:two-component system OmpR family response regulator
MSRPPVVRVADDDPSIREIVRFALEKEGIRAVEAKDGSEAVALFETERPDVLVLDILMPEMDGTEVCRRVRTRSSVPILFLSSRGDEVDKIVGLEVGADDYVTKPFSPRELVARVRAALRRGTPARETASPSARVLRHGRLELDLDLFKATWDGREVVLTRAEFGLIRALLGYPGKVYSREELMADGSVVSGRTIDSHIRRLRRKFQEAGGDPIATVHGVGYKVGPCG